MSRPPRIQYPGAIYHVTARGNRRAAIYHDQRDNLIWLDTLADTVIKHGIKVHAYCMMPNHYHLLIQTTDANLSEAMHMLNANYCRHFNERHQLSGHVLQGRFHAEHIESQQQLLAGARYIILNPVRAKLVAAPVDWPWSSHKHFLNPEHAPTWLEVQWLLSQFGECEQKKQIEAYQAFINMGIGLGNPLNPHRDRARLIHEKVKPLATYEARYPIRDEAIARAHQSNAYTRQQIADYFNVSVKTVSRALSRFPSSDR